MSARIRRCAGGNGAYAANVRIMRAHILAGLPAVQALWAAARAANVAGDRGQWRALADKAIRAQAKLMAVKAEPETKWCAAGDGLHHAPYWLWWQLAQPLWWAKECGQ